ncbi:MAG: hypothetical protein ABFS35_12455 [Bacteroidota bacterium]
MLQLLTGIIASSVHVISGPDHLAAITPLAIENKKKSWVIGLLWGIGHTMGVLIVGAFFLLFREQIPVEAISEYSELLVGLVLIMIGIWAFYRMKKNKENHHHVVFSKNTVAATSVGILHGLAGVSHLIGIIPTLALPSRIDAFLYLSGFTIGTISTMIFFAMALGYLAHNFSHSKKEEMLKKLQLTGVIAAISVGLFWIFSAI